MKKMKKIILILTLFVGFTTTAQYKEWSLEASYGGSNISDQSATIRGNEYLSHYDGVVRYNFSPTFGLGGYFGYSDLNLSNYQNQPLDMDFFRANISAVIDLYDIVDMQNDTFTLLAHSGPGVSYFDNGINDQYTFNISSGITGLFKLSNNLAIKLDYTMTAQFDQKNTLDSFFRNRNTQANSFVNNLSVGLAFYLNNNDEDELHADWYVKKPIVDTVYVYNETIIRNEANTVPIINECSCVLDENVFFKHDIDTIDKDGLNAIAKAIKYAKEGREITIIGYASDTESSSKYNKELSRRRAENVERKLILGGVDKNKIEVKYEGKDYTKPEPVHDLARTVKILVK